MDNLTFMGGSEDPHYGGPLHLGGQRRGLLVGPWSSARDLQAHISEGGGAGQGHGHADPGLGTCSGTTGSFISGTTLTQRQRCCSTRTRAIAPPGRRRRTTTASSCPTSTTAGTPQGSSSCGRPCRGGGAARGQPADRAPMNFGIFYDDRAETHCNTNPDIPGNQPTGQMYGAYYDRAAALRGQQR